MKVDMTTARETMDTVVIIGGKAELVSTTPFNRPPRWSVVVTTGTHGENVVEIKCDNARDARRLFDAVFCYSSNGGE